MKEYLVDVPVRVNIWIRPECQKKQFEIIKKARPSILFLQSDGGRNEGEWENIYANRRLIDEGIDWECTVYRFYEDHNNGLYAMAKKITEFIWQTVDRCIFLEDDILPSVSFFRFCAELLEKYKDDQRIEAICGMNHLGKYEVVQSDYFFSRQGSIWGMATWKRTYLERGIFEYANDAYVMKTLRERTKNNPTIWRRLRGYAQNEMYEGHMPAGEFWHEFHMYAQNRVQIIPKVNLIKNIGCTEDSAHMDSLNQMPHGIRRIFNMKIYEITFPLKHPRYVMPDIYYEKKRNKIMAYNTPVRHLIRLFDRALIKIISGRAKEIPEIVRKKFTHER